MRKSNVLSSVIKKMSVQKTSFFTMCYYSEFHQTTYVYFQRNDLQNDIKFSLGKCFLATQETLQIAHG